VTFVYCDGCAECFYNELDDSVSCCDTNQCGDGIIGCGEVCDDGNWNPWDGCSKNCRVI